MKLLSAMDSPRWALRSGQTAFTLAEFMVAMCIFALVIFAVIYSQMFGMKMFTMTQSKLTAANSARVVLNAVRDEIRSGKTMVVGNGGSNSFSKIAESFTPL